MNKRDQELIALFKTGVTITELAARFGFSKQRAQQILQKYSVSIFEGGRRKRCEQRAELKVADKEQKCLTKYGCTLTQLEEVHEERRRMQLAGKTQEMTPISAYLGQKASAKYRGISFHLTLWEWWTVWKESGKWSERGLGGGYVMCRKNDSGAYEVGNVFIDMSVNNVSFAKRKGTELPVGVTYRAANRNSPYVAQRAINGKQTYLGCFATAEEARCAYLSAVS